MKQLLLPFMEDEPALDELVQRLDDQRIGRVEFIARKGPGPHYYHVPLYVGDIVVRFSPGSHMVTSGGRYFWTKWRRVDVAEMASSAQREALDVLAGVHTS